MNDLQEALPLLRSLIQFDTRHQDFQYTVDLAQQYHDIFTGAGVETYLKKYRPSETDKMFKQMLEIYEPVIPSVVDNLDTVFEKPLRSNRVYSTIDMKERSARNELMDKIQKFWQGQTDSGVDAYLQERWKHDVLFDPNSFTVIEFQDFNPVKEKPQPFAITYDSRKVYNFKYVQGILDYLIVELPHRYKKREGQAFTFIDGSIFIMYLENAAIKLTEVDKDDKITDIPDPVFLEIMDKDNKEVARVFVQQIFETKSERVPAFRVGYKLDPVTNKRTCVSNIHYALAFFKKEIKSGAELDLTIRGHVFPQKYMYGPKCPGDVEKNKPCRRGQTTNGETCAVCGGTGTLPIHTTAQDVIVVPLPQKGEEPVLNLQQAMAYFSPPIELVKFMEEYSDRLTMKAKAAVFPSEDLYENPTFAKTATELDYSWDTRYDALRKFTAKYSFAWVFIIQQIAIYLDIELDTLELYHKFPSDFKMKSAKALLDEGKAAADGNFPQHVKKAIHDDIANLYYADDQDTLTRIQIKNKFYPFSGKTPSEVQSILISTEVIPYYKNLYIYFDIIFEKIDNEMGDKFYLMPYDKQANELKRRVDEISKQIVKATTFLEPEK